VYRIVARRLLSRGSLNIRGHHHSSNTEAGESTPENRQAPEPVFIELVVDVVVTSGPPEEAQRPQPNTV